MKHRVQLTPRARIDVNVAAYWWAKNRSRTQAAAWLTRFEEVVARLADEPNAFPVAIENDELPFEVREATFGLGRRKTPRIVFRIKGDRVLVHAIRHLAQDKLSPDEFTG